MDCPDKLKTNDPHLLPLFETGNDQTSIVGTQLVFKLDDENYGKKIVNMENFKEKDFQYENNFTLFGYKVYNRDLQGDNKILLIDIKLKQEVLSKSQLFNEYDKF
jgi:hypothetical protein